MICLPNRTIKTRYGGWEHVQEMKGRRRGIPTWCHRRGSEGVELMVIVYVMCDLDARGGGMWTLHVGFGD